MKKGILFGALALLILTAGTIDLNNLDNYANQTVPNYIQKDNTNGNAITDAGATLGRVLFYDKNLSANGTISCSSCHQQQFAFGDTAQLSVGLTAGLTGRHSMRLVNARFADEARFFWDERAATLEMQTTMPIQDHVEMGFSGTQGDPDIDSLIRKLSDIQYYNDLFDFVYGDTVITEARMQECLAQFVRSIQSFDSKFDVGRAQVANDAANFPNFTAQENQGKTLFLAPPPQGGAGCQGCHRAPEFDIDPNTDNNGVVQVANDTTLDLTNTRAPSLRDLFDPNGNLNGPLMHNGQFTTIQMVLNHYNQVPQNPNNTNLDQRLQGPGGNLGLTTAELAALEAFLKTLSGSNIYTDQKWSDPFDNQGNINVVLLNTAISKTASLDVQIYPNPVTDLINIQLPEGDYQINLLHISGKVISQQTSQGSLQLNLSDLNRGWYLIEVNDLQHQTRNVRKIRKQ